MPSALTSFTSRNQPLATVTLTGAVGLTSLALSSGRNVSEAPGDGASSGCFDPTVVQAAATAGTVRPKIVSARRRVSASPRWGLGYFTTPHDTGRRGQLRPARPGSHPRSRWTCGFILRIG
ncbi:Uncharacterised protein [Mycobacteroides abscessus subsp. abscessus]|nr:Uncharacterised protein [Mycobacteroides abscessus subsp. abscessus]